MKAEALFTLTTLLATALSTTGCRSTLYRAAERGDVETVRAELNDGADPEGTATSANLIWQIPAGIIAIPIDLLRLANPLGPIVDPGWYETNEVDAYGINKLDFDNKSFLTNKACLYRSKTAMDVATEKGHIDVITELILAGGKSSGWAKTKAITEAARKGDASTLRKLMEKGCAEKANSHVAGEYKPLMLAIGNGHEECARILLEHGAKINSNVIINKRKINIYDYATVKGQLALYKKLGGPIMTSPASITGKKIIFDFRAALIDEADQSSYSTYPKIKWNNKWKKMKHDPIVTSTFDKKKQAWADEYYFWLYKKTGSRKAEVVEGDYEGTHTHIT